MKWLIFFSLGLLFPVLGCAQKKYKKDTVTVKPKLGEIYKHQYYALSYVEECEQAEFVVYLTCKAHLIKEVERKDNFKEDPIIKTGSAKPDDYKSSGYDRGHLAPSADMCFNLLAMNETFFMSNMSPQKPNFNRKIWKALEEQVRDWTYEMDSIYVITGPILKDYISMKVIGENQVKVPNEYYKIVVNLKNMESIAFIIGQDDVIDKSESFQKWVVSIDEIELKTGLDFLNKLKKKDQKILESSVNQTWIKKE